MQQRFEISGLNRTHHVLATGSRLRLAKAWHIARLGLAGQSEGHGKARHGLAWWGTARQGREHAEDGQGRVLHFRNISEKGRDVCRFALAADPLGLSVCIVWYRAVRC